MAHEADRRDELGHGVLGLRHARAEVGEFGLERRDGGFDALLDQRLHCGRAGSHLLGNDVCHGLGEFAMDGDDLRSQRGRLLLDTFSDVLPDGGGDHRVNIRSFQTRGRRPSGRPA